MTKREAAVIMAVSGCALLVGDDLDYFYKYITELLGYPVWTHEIPALANEIKEKAMPEFVEICKNLEE